MNQKAQVNVAAMALSALVFILALGVFGVVHANLNTAAFSGSVLSLVNIYPLVLTGSAIIGIVLLAFRF